MSYEAIGFHGQPSDERRAMPPKTARDIMSAMNTVPLADETPLNQFVDSLKEPTRLDGWETTKAFVDCLRGDAYHLYWGDHGLLRPCLGTEHSAAVFDGSEIDYLPAFYERSGEAVPAEILQIKRITDVVQDDGKVLSVAQTGENFAQSRFNRLVTANFLRSMRLSRPIKRAIALLADANIIGGILQGFDTEQELTRFQKRWPPEFCDYRDDLLLASYLSDAGAHSSYRLIRNARTGFIEPAVRPNDTQLSFLFTRHSDGALTLTPDHSALLLERLPNINRLRYLLDGSRGPYAREDVMFTEIVSRKLAIRRKLHDEVQVIKKDGPRTDAISFADSDRHGKHIRINSYVQGMSPYVPTETMYWLPGDGRLWQRSVYVGNLALAFEAGDYMGADPASYRHADPEVQGMQRGITQAAPAEDSTIGRPLSVRDAWQTIHNLQGLM
jgi:hypothetical protein